MRGSATKTKSGAWRITISMGKNLKTGKYEKYQETFHGSKKDCDRRIAELINQFEKGVNINPEKITFGEYMDIWLKDYARKDLAPRTMIRHKGIIEMHLRPELGSIPLRKLTPAHLREYYTKALAHGRKDKKKSKGTQLSGTTVLYHHRLIRKMLQDALKTELVYRNVADAVDAPKKEQPEIKPLLKQDVPKLLKVLRNTYLYIPTLIAIATGARQGEVLGLQWKDVNLKEKTIFFRQQLQRFMNSEGEFEMVLRPLKTKKSVRRMDIPDSLVSELQKHRLEQKKQCLAAGETWQEHGFVCCHQDGRPIIPFTLSSYFRVMARRAGLEISFHGLRHGHATELISAGMQMNAVRDRLGHSEVGITLNTYAHVTPNQQKEITRIADDILASGLRQN